MAISLELLTDEAILDYTKSDGKDHVLNDHHDLNLKFAGIRPYPGGTFDVEIFGSPLEDRCLCGKIRQPSNEPCPYCNARVFTREQGLRRFARIDLAFYYLNDLRLDIFQELFKDIFKESTIKMDFAEGDLKSRGYGARRAKKLGIKIFDTCQFDYNPTTKELTISEFITDESKCSYEGLMKIIEEHFPDRLLEYKKLVNHYYLVMPAMMRPFSLRMINGKKTMSNHKLTVWYSVVIRFCSKNASKDANDTNYEDTIARFKTPGERVRYTALLRAMLNAGKKNATELLNTSKENLARGLYSVRTQNSARCPIVPDVNLAVDEISIPTHIAYEMMREGFMNYLIKELNFSKRDALTATKEEWKNSETQKLFKEYAEKQYVLNIVMVDVFTGTYYKTKNREMLETCGYSR